jgi:DNA-binding transcriptional MerR regulator
MAVMTAPTFNLDELCTLTDLPKRTVRYYAQIGLVDRPIGETRGAHYLDKHLQQLLRIKTLTQAGVSLDRIRDVLSGADAPLPPRVRQPGSVEVRTHLFIAPGIELQISPEEAGMSPEQVRNLVKAVLQAHQNLNVNQTLNSNKEK